MGKMLRIAGMSLSGLMVNRGRSALSMLGIVIGVFAVVLLTSLGNGVQEAITGKLTGVGSNLLTISPGNAEAQGRGPFAARSASTLTREDVEKVRSLPNVTAASASVPTAALAGTKTIPMTGVDPSYAQIRSVDLAAGRFVEHSGEVVLETAVAKDLLKSGPKDAVGKTLEIRSESMVDSAKNCFRMSPLRAPILLRMPISFVRSVTETSMMFMIPMPPTSKEMLAIAPRSRLPRARGRRP